MTKILTIQNSDGIHARPASLFSTTANHYVSEIQIGRIGEKKINAKSIILLLSLGLKQGEKIEISDMYKVKLPAIHFYLKHMLEKLF